MADDNIQNLLGGFATGSLTDRERELLFTAALKDQDLFNALADEEVLREYLSDPVARQRVLRLLQPEAPGIFDRLTSWMRRPIGWAVAGAAVAALAVTVVMRDSRPSAVEMARADLPANTASQSPAAPEPLRDEARNRAQDQAAPAPEAFKKASAPAPKMKVAVLEFDSGPAPAKEAESKSADLGKTASEMLVKKLDSSGYAVVDRKQVADALQAQKLNERQLNPAAAASLGRSLGADAVIMGAVKPSVVLGFRDSGGVVGGAAPAAPATRAKSEQSDRVEVTASAIDTQSAANLGYVQSQQIAAGALSGAVDQVASSLGQQIQQNARIRIDGLVTDVNAKVLTLNVGVRVGVRIGDRLEIRRAGKSIGRVAITAVQDSNSVGLFDGPDPAKPGDAVSNQ